jgi:hypothetical protein
MLEHSLIKQVTVLTVFADLKVPCVFMDISNIFFILFKIYYRQLCNV